jgi:hypothetical protein
MRGRVLTVAAVAAGLGLAGAGPASAATEDRGSRSLAQVLLSDGNRFDTDWYDYDIVTEAVLAVLAAKPNSPVSVLTDGTVPLTAFVPNDRAFQKLATDLSRDLSKTPIGSEKRVFDTIVSAVGVDAVEQVLLYHVVPGAPITSATALKSDGARLNTALPGASFTVDVINGRYKIVQLVDNDPNDRNPFLNPSALDINKGNRQIAHGIQFVLRPIDL